MARAVSILEVIANTRVRCGRIESSVVDELLLMEGNGGSTAGLWTCQVLAEGPDDDMRSRERGVT